MDEVRELGASAAGQIQCLTIVGQIEGHQLLPEDAKTTRYEHQRVRPFSSVRSSRMRPTQTRS